jgi:hypothetical protein
VAARNDRRQRLELDRSSRNAATTNTHGDDQQPERALDEEAERPGDAGQHDEKDHQQRHGLLHPNPGPGRSRHGSGRSGLAPGLAVAGVIGVGQRERVQHVRRRIANRLLQRLITQDEQLLQRADEFSLRNAFGAQPFARARG